MGEQKKTASFIDVAGDSIYGDSIYGDSI